MVLVAQLSMGRLYDPPQNPEYRASGRNTTTPEYMAKFVKYIIDRRIVSFLKSDFKMSEIDPRFWGDCTTIFKVGGRQTPFSFAMC